LEGEVASAALEPEAVASGAVMRPAKKAPVLARAIAPAMARVRFGELMGRLRVKRRQRRDSFISSEI
jgi:hypothetical protein